MPKAPKARGRKVFLPAITTPSTLNKSLNPKQKRLSTNLARHVRKSALKQISRAASQQRKALAGQL